MIKSNLSKFIFFIVATSINFSCQKKSSSLEIYTLKAENEEVEVSYDSLSKEFIYAPKFTVSESLLNANARLLKNEVFSLSSKDNVKTYDKKLETVSERDSIFLRYDDK